MAASVGVGSWHTFTLNFGAPVDLFRVEQPENGQLVIHLCSQQDVLAAVQYRLTRLQPSVHIPAADAGTTSLVMPFSGCYGSESVDQLCRELGIVAQTLTSVDQPMEVSTDASETTGQISDSTDNDLPDFLCSVFNNKDNSIRLDPVSSTDPINAEVSVNTTQNNAMVVEKDNEHCDSKDVRILSSPPVFPQREMNDSQQDNKQLVLAVNPQPIVDQNRSVQLATLMAAVVKGSSSSATPTVALVPAQIANMHTNMMGNSIGSIAYQFPTVTSISNASDNSNCSALVPAKPVSSSSSNTHVCPHCNLQFNRHCNLQRHISLVHAMGGKALASKVCPLCRVMKCRQYKPLIDHVMTEHQIAARIDSIQFASDVAFHGWKRELECRSGASFVQKSGSKAVKKTINTYFACNRSGAAVTTPGEKKKGKSKEEGPTCIAFIRTAKCMESGTIQATYCLTHLGH